MIYLREFMPSQKKNILSHVYPYRQLAGRFAEPLEFAGITILYGNNGAGKSTLLNLIAGKLGMEGEEQYPDYQSTIDQFIRESTYYMGRDERGLPYHLPQNSKYIKSEDVLYEVKKVESLEVTKEAYHLGDSAEDRRELKRIRFNQDKYSNGEVALQIYEREFQPDGLYLLDEPEVSLSMQNQTVLAEMITRMTRFFSCQFIIATHSPVLIIGLEAVIYNLDLPVVRQASCCELENVRYLYDFFMKHRNKFELP